MSIRFPDFSVLFHRSVDRNAPQQQGGALPTPEHAHLQAVQMAQENERRRAVIEQGREADRAALERRRERERKSGRGTKSANREKGRHVDLKA